MMRILVTGANGFVGRGLCDLLRERGCTVRAALRSRAAAGAPLAADEVVEIGDLGPRTEWVEALERVDAVVHLAARVHVMRETETDPAAAFARVNIAPTLALAQAAAGSGVRRLVYVSTVKVNGERTNGNPFSEDDLPSPEDAYARSKREAEVGLLEIARKSSLEVTVVRPPLVYGPRVKGNFLSLLDWAYRAAPLPLALARAQRSLIGARNLASALAECATHPKAANETFLVSDGEDLSTSELLRRTAAALERPCRLLPFPAAALRAMAGLTGQRAAVSRLMDSLRVDSGKIRRFLGWRPPASVDEQLRLTAQWYLTQRSALS
jgi:UDP-4-keto-D-QuiNAc 4-reductase